MGSPRIIPPHFLLDAYRGGIFPMAVEGGQIAWFSPPKRGVLPLPQGKDWVRELPHGVRRDLRRHPWVIRCDTAFSSVMESCASRPETWIDEVILASYGELHRRGHAHSVEVWLGDELAGGLYGVRLGGAFFGESMFHRVSGASKAALVALMGGLAAGGFRLLDTQWITAHLRQFGAVEIPRALYLELLRKALRRSPPFPADEIAGFFGPQF